MVQYYGEIMLKENDHRAKFKLIKVSISKFDDLWRASTASNSTQITCDHALLFLSRVGWYWQMMGVRKSTAIFGKISLGFTSSILLTKMETSSHAKNKVWWTDRKTNCFAAAHETWFRIISKALIYCLIWHQQLSIAHVHFFDTS